MDAQETLDQGNTGEGVRRSLPTTTLVILLAIALAIIAVVGIASVQMQESEEIVEQQRDASVEARLETLKQLSASSDSTSRPDRDTRAAILESLRQ